MRRPDLLGVINKAEEILTALSAMNVKLDDLATKLDAIETNTDSSGPIKGRVESIDNRLAAGIGVTLL